MNRKQYLKLVLVCAVASMIGGMGVNLCFKSIAPVYAKQPSPEQRQKVVRAERFEVIDSKGEVTAVLAHTQGRSYLMVGSKSHTAVLLAEQGQAYFALGSRFRNIEMRVTDDKTTQSFGLWYPNIPLPPPPDPCKVVITLSDTRHLPGKKGALEGYYPTSLELAIREDLSSLDIEHGFLNRVAIKAGEKLEGLTIYDKAKGTRARSHLDGSSFTFWDEDGDMRAIWQVPKDKYEDVYMYFFDRAGKATWSTK